MRKLLLLGAAPLIMGFFVMMLIFSGGGSGTAETLPRVSTEETAIHYAICASKLGAPWDIVMITDAVYADRENKGSIEDVNPIHTSLQFSIMTITVETWEVISSTYYIDTDSWEDNYDWVFSHRETYTGRDEITENLGIDGAELEVMDADSFLAVMDTKMQLRSTTGTRYTATLSANTEFDTVLHSYTALTEQEIQSILELFDADYILQQLESETQQQILTTLGQYGMYQYLDMEGYVNYEGLVFTGAATQVVYFNQMDARWADAPYGTDNIGRYGCGPTSMAIAISSLTNQTLDPIYMANWSYQNGYWAKGRGSYHSLVTGAATAFGLTASGCTAADPQRIVDALERGDLVVVLMAKGHFTSSGHFIVLRGVTESGKILVADPASYSRSEQAWDFSIILAEAMNSAGAGGPFWIIGA